MSAEKILLDSNSYFRLADNLYPLLSQEFGTQKTYKLFILGGTLLEYNYQSRLQNKFSWVDNPKHKEDRKKNKLRLSANIKKTVKSTIRFLQETCNNLLLGCSPFDTECAACALELNIILVTDDQDLLKLADEYEIQTMTTLKLLKLMLDEKRISMKDVQDTVYMWDYDRDLPANFLKDFKKLFSCNPERFS